jgi:hypothetical protein
MSIQRMTLLAMSGLGLLFCGPVLRQLVQLNAAAAKST